jgi:hypothetical protein
MRRGTLAGLALALTAACLSTRHAAAMGFDAMIDLDYIYEQQDTAGDVNATTTFTQKYEARFDTSLTSAVDLAGAVRLELQDSWYVDEAHTSKLTPTLELVAVGIRSGAKITYQGDIAKTDAYREAAEQEIYSNSLSGDLFVTPLLWPEIKLQYQRKRDYQQQIKDSTATTFQLSLLKDLGRYGARLGLDIKKDATDEVLPESRTTDTLEWTGNATYKELLFRGTEFEIDYQITENQTEERTRGVFVSSSESYVQQLKARLRNSFNLLSQLTFALSWEYSFDQDLLALDYDYKVDNRYSLDVRWDMLPWLKFAGAATRETNRVVNAVGEGEDRDFNDSLKGTLDANPVSWLQLGATVEFSRDEALSEITGGAVDRSEERKFELVAKNRIGEWWDLTMNFSGNESRTDGWLTDRNNDFKADLALRLLDDLYQKLAIMPSYQVGRTTSWEFGSDGPVSETRTTDAKIRIDYQLRVLNLLTAKFAHEYGVTMDESLDPVLDFEDTLSINETTSLNIALEEIVRDLRIDGDIQRTASDTEDDTEPMLVDVAYRLNLAWKYESVALAASLQYNDKGDADDDVSLNAKIGYAGDRLLLSGEYQFTKVYAEEIDEERKLNLKLGYKF